MQKRLIAIHDISCVGKCSLTVAMPVISASGVEVSVLPTAILSTHTGGFKDYTFNDLTNQLEPILEHWLKLDLSVDAIYSGYLGSYEQIDIVKKFIDKIRNKESKALVIIDPVMGDNGKMYTAFAKDYPKGMLELVKKADLIVPNLTETALLLDEEYKEAPYTKNYIEEILRKLSKLGPRKVVLTGVSFKEDEIGAAAYDADSDSITYIFTKKVDGYYHGTGDLFASALAGAILNGHTLEGSTRIAADYTYSSILRTYNQHTDVKYGVNFEEGIYDYAAAIRNR